jgi:hypothetical protein
LALARPADRHRREAEDADAHAEQHLPGEEGDALHQLTSAARFTGVSHAGL